MTVEGLVVAVLDMVGLVIEATVDGVIATVSGIVDVSGKEASAGGCGCRNYKGD